MFLTKIKNLLKPPAKLETPLLLTKEISESFETLLAPLDISVVPFVMEKIKAKTAKKNTLSYRLRYNLVPVALTIFLVFALTGTGSLSGYKNNRTPIFSASLAPIVTSGDKSNALIGVPPKTISPPPIPSKAAATPSLKAKSKTKIFFQKIWNFVLTLWQ